MERAEYLALCKQAAMALDCENTAKVAHGNIVYTPFGYELKFDRNGSVIHTAILLEDATNTLYYCRLRDVTPVNK